MRVDFRYARVGVLIALLGAVVVAWGWLFIQHDRMYVRPVSEMWMAPTVIWAWTTADFVFVYAMWAVMMAAMMLPSAIPVIVLFVGISRHQTRFWSLCTLYFSAAYVLVWQVFSIGLTLIQWQFHGFAWLSPMMEARSLSMAASLFLLAGVYQFSPMKNVCLRRCRTPFGYLMGEWQPGARGAFSMGLKHGLNCVGCCWAEMFLMFAVGVMNLIAMGLITVLVTMEKNLPRNASLVSRTGGALLIGWGVYLGFNG